MYDAAFITPEPVDVLVLLIVTPVALFVLAV
jgi:hypothetical protein